MNSTEKILLATFKNGLLWLAIYNCKFALCHTGSLINDNSSFSPPLLFPLPPTFPPLSSHLPSLLFSSPSLSVPFPSLSPLPILSLSLATDALLRATIILASAVDLHIRCCKFKKSPKEERNRYCYGIICTIFLLPCFIPIPHI